jgi:hypothetical protein
MAHKYEGILFSSTLLVADAAAVAQLMVTVAALHLRRAGYRFNRMADQAVPEQRNRVTGYLGIPDWRMTEQTVVMITGLNPRRGGGQDDLTAYQQMMFVDIGITQHRKLNEIVMTAAAIRFPGQAVPAGNASICAASAVCPALRPGKELESGQQKSGGKKSPVLEKKPGHWKKCRPWSIHAVFHFIHQKNSDVFSLT